MVGTVVRFARDWSTYRAGATLPLQPVLADWLVARGFAQYVNAEDAPPAQEAATGAQSPAAPSAPADESEAPRRRGRPRRAQ